MKKYSSPTSNGGTTIILNSLDQAIEAGKKYIDDTITRIEGMKGKVSVVSQKRDGGTSTPKKVEANSLLEGWKNNKLHYGMCVEAITKGTSSEKENISRLVEELEALVAELAPSLRANYAGFSRSADGVTASPELLAAGEEMCCFRRKEGASDVKQGTGDGAYRIIINTDVSWWGQPTDNAALVGALVVILQQFKPVEVWIQQGWLGPDYGNGVTLFKLDFTGAFDPTQLAFWIGHWGKDSTFSNYVNRGLGRTDSGTSTAAEIEADLMLRGDWMRLYGIESAEQFVNMLHTDKMDIMSKWIADTAVQMVFLGQGDQGPQITED